MHTRARGRVFTPNNVHRGIHDKAREQRREPLIHEVILVKEGALHKGVWARPDRPHKHQRAPAALDLHRRVLDLNRCARGVVEQVLLEHTCRGRKLLRHLWRGLGLHDVVCPHHLRDDASTSIELLT